MKKLLAVDEASAGERLDKWLVNKINLSRAQIQELISSELVKVNSLPIKSSYHIKRGDHVEITILPKEREELLPEKIPLKILYEDEDIVVVDKPSGLVTHPSPGHLQGTLVNALLWGGRKLSSIGAPLRPGIVHRLDKETSGIIVVAKSDKAHIDLVRQFKNREIEKVYIALVHGDFDEDEGIIEMPIGRRHGRGANRKRMWVTAKGSKPALTEFKVLKRFKRHGRSATLLEVRPKTGRTHQIRVHLRHIGHPIVGDEKYGRRDQTIPSTRLMLHALSLKLWHPRRGKRMGFTAPLPIEFLSAPEGDHQVIKTCEIGESNTRIDNLLIKRRLKKSE